MGGRGCNRGRVDVDDAVGMPAAKVVLDRIGGFLVLALMLPLMLVIGIVVAIDSPGGVFRTSRCVGARGREFALLRFRTSSTTDPALAPRLTRVGGVLRRYNLDELPQLLNVITGRMSLVGPSPGMTEQADGRVVSQSWVRPGLIGLGPAAEPVSDAAERIHLYVHEWRLSDDLAILWNTACDVVRADQSS